MTWRDIELSQDRKKHYQAFFREDLKIAKEYIVQGASESWKKDERKVFRPSQIFNMIEHDKN